MEKFVKVLLVNPPSLTEIPDISKGISYYDWLKLKNNEAEFIPGELLGCQCIQNYVEKNNKNCSIDILNACTEMHISIQQTLDAIETKMPLDIIGFTGPYSVFDEIEYLAKRIKELHPEICIIYGQYFASLCYKEILTKYSFFDFISIGYGEVAISKMIDYKQGKVGIKDIPAVSYRNCENEVVVNPSISAAKELIEILPTRYEVDKVLKTGLNISIFCSRGCLYRCSFCATGSLMKKCNTPFLLRDPISVVDEIEYLYNKFGIKRLTIVDDTFAANTKEAKEQARDIALEILKRNIKIQMMIDTRIDCIDEELFILLKKAGVVKAFVGIEAANNDNLQEYNKGYKSEIIIEKITILKKIGIEIVPGFITFNPDSTLETLRANANLIRQIPTSDPSMYSYEYIPYPGTDLTNKYICEGLVVGDFPHYKNKYRLPEVELVKQAYDRLLSRYSSFLIGKSKLSQFDIKEYHLIYEQIKELFADYFLELVYWVEKGMMDVLDDIYITYNNRLKELLKSILILELNSK